MNVETVQNILRNIMNNTQKKPSLKSINSKFT